LPVFEGVDVPALSAQFVAQQAQVNLVVGRKAVEGKSAQCGQIILRESIVGLPLGSVGNQQQRVVFMVALA